MLHAKTRLTTKMAAKMTDPAQIVASSNSFGMWLWGIAGTIISLLGANAVWNHRREQAQTADTLKLIFAKLEKIETDLIDHKMMVAADIPSTDKMEKSLGELEIKIGYRLIMVEKMIRNKFDEAKQ